MGNEQVAQSIRFDDVHIDVTGRRLFVARNEIALEPKVFDVLALLAQNSGRTLLRNEIIDAVWGHRHVTPGVLNRAIALIRQALRVDGLDRQYLQTLHGKGYRLDLVKGPSCVQDEAEGVDPDLANHEDCTAVIAEAIPGDLQASPFALPPRIDVAMSQSRRRGSSRRRLIVILGILVALCGSFFVLTLSKKSRGAFEATLAPTLVVLPLNAVGGDRDESNFADGLSEELITRLTHIEGLRLISSTSAARAKREGFGAQQLADQLHVTHALEGSLRHEHDMLRIDLRLIETPSGRTLWAQTFDRRLADVFALQQEIAQDVASTLALRIGHRSVYKVDVDPQVFLEYLQLRHVFAAQLNYTDEDENDLHALAARAPDFAPAHGLLALNLASDFEPHSADDVIAEANLALKLDPETIYAHAALGELACRRFDWVLCMGELRTALSLDPSDSIIRLVYGMWCANLGYRDRALLQFETAYAADPLNYWTNFQRGTQLDALGRHDEAKRFLDALPGLDPDSDDYTTTARWRNAVFRRDFVDAQAMVKLLPNTKHLHDAHAATTRALQDPSRWPEADSTIALRERELNDHIWLRLFQPKPDIATILTMVETSLRGRDLSGRFFWAVDLAALRNYPEFTAMLHRTRIYDFWQTDGWPSQCAPLKNEVVCH